MNGLEWFILGSLSTIILCLLFVVVVIQFRNNKVKALSDDLIDRIHDANIADLYNDANTDALLDGTLSRVLNNRWKTFESVSYYTMVAKFWKPVKAEAFYDLSFLEPMSKDADE
jgi:hypothetical protein